MKKIFLLILMLLMISTSVWAKNVNITWNQSSESDLAGYCLYRNGNIIVGPDVLTKTTTIYVYDETNSISVYTLTAVDTSANESEPSDPVWFIDKEFNSDTTPPGKISISITIQ